MVHSRDTSLFSAPGDMGTRYSVLLCVETGFFGLCECVCVSYRVGRVGAGLFELPLAEVRPEHLLAAAPPSTLERPSPHG